MSQTLKASPPSAPVFRSPQQQCVPYADRTQLVTFDTSLASGFRGRYPGKASPPPSRRSTRKPLFPRRVPAKTERREHFSSSFPFLASSFPFLFIAPFLPAFSYFTWSSSPLGSALLHALPSRSFPFSSRLLASLVQGWKRRTKPFRKKMTRIPIGFFWSCVCSDPFKSLLLCCAV